MAKILQVCNSGFFLDKFLSPLVNSLVANGHEIICLCEGEVNPNLYPPGVRFINFQFPRKGNPILFLKKIREMKKILEQERIEILNSHNRNSSIIARAACALLTRPKPKNLYTARGFYFHDGQGLLKKMISIGIEALLAPVTDFTLSQSEEDKKFVSKLKILPPQKILTIYNGIQTQFFVPSAPENKPELEKSLHLKPSSFRLAITSRLVPGKGLEDLIEAFQACAQERDELLIIGGNIPQDRGGIQDHLIQTIQHYRGPGRIRLTGLTTQVKDFLQVSDAFILPSYREGMPRSLIEALSCALPCAASNIRGCREILNACDPSPILFRPGRQDEIVKAIEELRRRANYEGPNLYGRQKVIESFDEGPYLRRQIEVTESLVNLG